MPSLSKSPPSPPSPRSLFHQDNCEAERRLEAEELLREAIVELQRRQRLAVLDCPCPPCDHPPDESCVAHAIGNLCQSFLLSYGVRVGVGILLRAFKLAKGQSYASLLDLKVNSFSFRHSFVIFIIIMLNCCSATNYRLNLLQCVKMYIKILWQQLVSEKDLIVREEACRVGLLFGGFTGSYHALRCLLRKLRRKETPFNA